MDESFQRSLEDYGKVLYPTADALASPRAYGRQSQVDLLLRRWLGPQRGSVILLGPSGVGKTAIIHEAARQMALAENALPVLETSTTQMLAGTQWLGEFQTRVKNLSKLVAGPRAVLYFTDIPNVPQAGQTTHSHDNVGSILAPLMEAGEILLCGECTPEQFRLTIESNVKFAKLFELLRLEELTLGETRSILESVVGSSRAAERNGAAPNLSVSSAALDAVLELSKDYFPGQVFPGKAVRLLQRVIEPEGPRGSEPPAAQRRVPRVVGQEQVVRALEQMTGIPARLLDDSQPLDLADAKKFFEARVVGQREAIDAMVDLITLVKAGLTDPQKPMGVLLFVGPTGVGKTEMARTLAEFVFGSADRLIRYDMSEYKDFQSFEKLIGNPQASEHSSMRRGTLISRVRQQPFAVILFDEIEKAHPNIFDLFLQLFDAGRLTDVQGQVTNFTRTVIIMTSNAGSDLRKPASFGFRADEQSSLDEEIGEALKYAFRPEFLNRIDRIVTFQPLEREQMRVIAQRELGRVLLRSGIIRREMLVDVDPAVIDILLKQGFNREYGARPLKRAVERLALLPIARQMVKLAGRDSPRVLRLQPAGDSIQVRVVEERESRAPRIVKFPLVDPLRNRKIKLGFEQLDQRAAALDRQVVTLEDGCRTASLPQRKASLLAETTRVDFWDDHGHARQVLGEVHRLERIMESVARVRKRVDDLRAAFDLGHEERDDALLASWAERLVELERDVGIVRYAVVCHGPLDTADAVISLTRLGDDATDDDLVGLLGDMYLNWARFKGFHASILHEELADPVGTRELVLLVSGVSVYGVLKGEAGIHEFVYGKTSKESRQSEFVKARLLPLGERAETSGKPQIETHVEPTKGSGHHVRRFKTAISLTHLPSLVSIRARNGLSSEEATDLCGDWLEAEIAYRKSTLNVPPTEIEEIARKYTMRPTSSAKDPRTGVTVPSLRDLWKGGLDAFLEGWLSGERAPT